MKKKSSSKLKKKSVLKKKLNPQTHVAKTRSLKARSSNKTALQKSPKKSLAKIDESLLNLPHSSLKKISKSIEKIQNFSNELVEKSGVAIVLGRAVLLRAKEIRASLVSSKSKAVKKAVKKAN